MDKHEMFTVPQGTFDLRRLHDGADSPLRAWDAADEYVLDHLSSIELSNRSIVVANDSHGALTVALGAHRPVAVSDSSLSWMGTIANLERNRSSARSAQQLQPISEQTKQPAEQIEEVGADFVFCAPSGAPPTGIDVAVIKVPKALALLEYELSMLAPLLSPGAVVIGAGMTRHIHSSTIEVFERTIGPTTTSLARRKARLIHASPRTATRGGTSPAEGQQDDAPLTLIDDRSPTWSRFELPGSDATVVSGPGVFAGAKLDVGTRLLLEHLATRQPASEVTDVIDLGCGNGVVGLSILLADPAAEVSFVDQSPVAVQSAQATVRASQKGSGSIEARCRFFLGDALDAVLPFSQPSSHRHSWSAQEIGRARQVDTESADLVVINPPFHEDHAIGDAIAWRMFNGARRVLRPGGEILVIGNRHLGYHAKLRRLFGACTVAAANPKFVVLSATR